VTAPAARTVPVRDFSLDGTGELPAGKGTDRHARFGVLAGDKDSPRGRLRAGEALSGATLSAVQNGLLPGIGYPFLVLRVGVAEPTDAIEVT
jgi:hypothetical protein